ncbi:MAG TPA: FAD binding domain-containing protein [Syntrophorhabdaceae bacterium]|nr:FAD binding domain-containing protein [Syntrophorhabdaceae bacterium]
MKITFILNGKKVDCDIEKDERLLYTLRERLSIKSVKEGCGIGECGTCTVLIDDEPHYSCLTLTSKVQGHDVKTVEFLSASGNLHPLQEAFIKAGAVQCGYCTPGMLLSAYSLLIKEKEPSVEKIREAISGNLCRCTGYQQIVEAVQSVAVSTDNDKGNKEAINSTAKVHNVNKEDILDVLSGKKGALIIAGGTDLLVKERKDRIPGDYVDISCIDELKGIKENGGNIFIGALTTHAAISKSDIIKKKAGSLAMACGMVGSPQIRNMGTIGGNLVNASPAADSIPPLLIHDALCNLESKEGERLVKLGDFITAPYKTSIAHNEILTYIKITGFEGYREGYVKIAKRAALAIARMSVAWAIKEKEGNFEDVRISIGSCTPMPFRPKDAEDFLKGKDKGDKEIKEAVSMIINGIVEKSGMRPSYRYKLPVLEGVLLRLLRG